MVSNFRNIQPAPCPVSAFVNVHCLTLAGRQDAILMMRRDASSSVSPIFPLVYVSHDAFFCACARPIKKEAKREQKTQDAWSTSFLGRPRSTTAYA